MGLRGKPAKGLLHQCGTALGARAARHWYPVSCYVGPSRDGWETNASYDQTFDKQDDRPGATSSYTAPFTGIHGWYWQNRTDRPVTLKLTATGFFVESQEFRRGQSPRQKTF